MASKFGQEAEEEDVLAPKEPQVTSQDANERRAARALRIKRRQEALRRADQTLDEIPAEEAPGPIELAASSAAEELQRLSLDGAAKVTNVKVTTDEREVIRRGLFSDNMKESLRIIEAEANEAQSKYEEISGNWDAMLKISDPLDIDVAIQEQNLKCKQLMEEKDAVINHLKDELLRMDQAYYDDLFKQDRDIKELSDRVEKQVTIMQRAYQKQLFLITQAIDFEREAMVTHNSKRWVALYRQRDREEVEHMEYKFEQLSEHKEQMEEIMWDHYEKYREAKIELESLIQELQRELEKLKAICIINSEKIAYNYQILKKREEENVFVRSQQKRKLNKMSDVANGLRSKIRKAAEDGAQEEIRADAEILKLLEAMADLEKKSDHFSHVNDYKFTQVWRMSAVKCAELMRELRRAEVALHGRVLSEPPPSSAPRPPQNPLHNEADGDPRVEVETQEETKAVDLDNPAVSSDKDRLVRHILQLVADNTGFLLEERLLKLIEKYQTGVRNLCTLDAIFMALEIQAEEDIELLCKTFLDYAYCPICEGFNTGGDGLKDVSTKCSNCDEPAERCQCQVGAGNQSSTQPHRSALQERELSKSDLMLMSEADEILQKCGDAKVVLASIGDGVSTDGSRTARGKERGVVASMAHAATAKNHNPFLCPANHPLQIEPMQVLMALGEFIKVFVPPEKEKLYEILEGVKPRDFTTPSRRLTKAQIERYWTDWKNVFPKEKDRFWDGLLTGLNNYLLTLQERERVHEEVVELRRRNAALKRLARGALPEAPVLPPKYLRPPPAAFTAPVPDDAAQLLPPI